MYSTCVQPFAECWPKDYYSLSGENGKETRQIINDTMAIILRLVEKPYSAETLPVSKVRLSSLPKSSTVFTSMTLSSASLVTRSKRVKDYILSFREISANWNGAGSVAPSRDTISNAIGFVSELEDRNLAFPALEDIQIMPYGSIVLDINVDRGLVSVEIGSKKLGYFTDFSESKNYGSEGMSYSGKDIPKDLAVLLS